MKSLLQVVLLMLICLMDLWVIVGVFRDGAALFRYMNYFAIYIPIVTFVAATLLFVFTRQWYLRVGVVIVSLLPILLTYPLPGMAAKGERWALSARQVSNQTFDFVTFSKAGPNHEYQRVGQLIDCNKHDIMVVQEISDFDQFAAATPEAVANCNVVMPDNKWKSIAILSRHPMKDVYFNESGIRATVHINGHDIVVQTRRFDRSITDSGIRLQLAQINDALAELRDISTVIIAGDFNSTQHNESLFRVRNEFAYADPGGFPLPSSTFPAAKRWYAFLGPFVRIDHVFYRGLGLISSEVLEDSYGSDHYPVKAIFALPAEKELVNE